MPLLDIILEKLLFADRRHCYKRAVKSQPAHRRRALFRSLYFKEKAALLDFEENHRSGLFVLRIDR